LATQFEKAERFRALHERDEAFVIPNPWDAGSARILEKLGFEALATTSAGFAQSLGRLDGAVTLEEAIRHCRELAAITSIPISADLENGFADDPEGVARAIRLAAKAGVVGASIEDYSGRSIYEFDLAVDRVRAAVEAARSLDFPFTLTARAENLLRGVDDLEDTIRRLQAFAEAGADVLYAPGLGNLQDLRRVTGKVDKPFNVLAPFFAGATIREFSEAGARRISVGSALADAALGVAVTAGRELLDRGSFNWLEEAHAKIDIGGMLR
jgi:2-methylisocitrate lyase-like PEP mutase family enzyme